MKFWKAMKVVDEGGMVRRSDWGWFVESCSLVEGKVVLKKGNDVELFEPTSNDFTSEDWVIADPCDCECKNSWSTEMNGKCTECRKWRQVE
jgi:hypothetical protein